MAARGQSGEHGSQGSWAGAGELGQEHASHGAEGGVQERLLVTSLLPALASGPVMCWTESPGDASKS